jgi:hypothetical protein
VKGSPHKGAAVRRCVGPRPIEPLKPYAGLVEDLSLFTFHGWEDVISTFAPAPDPRLIQFPSLFSISATFASSSFTRWLSRDNRLKFIFCWMKSRTGTAGLPMTDCRGATLPETPA